MNGMDPERARARDAVARFLPSSRSTSRTDSRDDVDRVSSARTDDTRECGREMSTSVANECMHACARDGHELHMSEDMRQSSIYVRFRRYSTHTRDVRTRDTVHGLLYLSTTNTRPSRDHTRAYETKPKDPIGIGPDRAATSLDRSTTLDANDGQGPRETARGDVLPLPHAHRGDARAV